jgi:hypothetical protein
MRDAEEHQLDNFVSPGAALSVGDGSDPIAVVALIWAALVLVPWGLRLSEESGRGEIVRRVLHGASWLQLPAAVLLTASFLLDQGPLAAALAIGWFAVTLLCAVAGGLDLVQRGARLDARAAMLAAMLFLPVGGGWAVISRSGTRPQDFSHAIVLLTAVHFHYAGFLLPVIAGLVLRSFAAQSQPNEPSPQPSPNGRGGLLDRLMLAAIIAGVPLVGVGISLSPHIEVAAAMLLTIGCVLLAGRQLQLALASRSATALTLLAISSLTLFSAMGLAAVYAAGEFTGEQVLSIPTMIRTHGAANAIGFATCGLAGWHFVTAGPRPEGHP